MSSMIKNPFISTGSSGTPADVPNASTSQVGKVQLSNAIDSDSQLQASTPLAVKTALTEAKEYTDDAIANLNVQDGDLTQKGVVQLSSDIIEDDTLSATPKAVFDALVEAKEYTDKVIDDLDSTLEKYSFELRPIVQGQLEFDMPPIYNQNPDYYIDFLFFNSTKVLESKYLIVEKVVGDPTQGFKLVLASPAPDYNSAIYNLILIGGKALGVGGNNLSDSYFHTGSTPPTNKNLIWNKI